jgi:hypothetical protein
MQAVSSAIQKLDAKFCRNSDISFGGPQMKRAGTLFGSPCESRSSATQARRVEQRDDAEAA